MAHLYAQCPQVASRNSLGRTTVRDRATPSRMSHLRRRFNRSSSDVEASFLFVQFVVERCDLFLATYLSLTTLFRFIESAFFPLFDYFF